MSQELVSIPLPVTKPFSGTSVEPELRWFEASDGQMLACRVYRSHSCAPVIVYLHGIEGHSQWFHNTASLLNLRGLTVYAADRRGAGLNSNQRGHLESYKTLLADIEIILRTAACENPGQPIYMFGNCWGGKAASVMAGDDYRSTDGEPLPRLAGLILTCPAIHTKVDLDWRAKLDIGYCMVRGGHYSRKTLAIPIEPHMFTEDPTYLEFVSNDPLRLLNATTKFFFEQFLLTLKAKNACRHLNLPVLLVESGKDEIVDVSALDRWFDKVKSVDKSKRMFAKAAHSIEFDPIWFDDYCQTLSDWILTRAPGAVA